MYEYQINQFNVFSDIKLPCNDLPRHNKCLPFVYVRLLAEGFPPFSSVALVGNRYNGLSRAYDVGSGLLIAIRDDVVMFVRNDGAEIHFSFPNISRHRMDFCMEEIYKAKQISLARSLAINLGLSICSLLRGSLPLHGAGIRICGKTIGILAPSGTGKSTFLWYLLDNGGIFSNDDVLPIEINKNSAVLVPSKSLHSKLSDGELRNRDFRICDFDETMPGSGEFWVPIELSLREVTPQLLHGLFILCPDSSLNFDDVVINKIDKGYAIHALLSNTQGLWVAYGNIDSRNILSTYQKLISTVPVYRVRYRKTMSALPLLTHKIISLLQSYVGNF